MSLMVPFRTPIWVSKGPLELAIHPPFILAPVLPWSTLQCLGVLSPSELFTCQLFLEGGDGAHCRLLVVRFGFQRI
jgi:hypothetical protein